MRKLYAYEYYINSEYARYGYNEDNIPSSLIHEKQVFSWMVSLSRELFNAFSYRIIPIKLMERLKNIRTNRHGKYRNLSPVLDKDVHDFICECGDLYDDLNSSDDFFKNNGTISEQGCERFRLAIETIKNFLSFEPKINK